MKMSFRRLRQSLLLGLCSGAIAASTVGCGSSASTDRADARSDARDASPAAAESQLIVTSHHEIKPSAIQAGRPKIAVEPEPDPQQAQHAEPIATPLPSEIISTAEAEAKPAVPTAIAAGLAPGLNSLAGSPTLAPPQKPKRAQATQAEVAAATVDAAAALRQADERVRLGVAAASKGAWFTARTEFYESLRLVAAAHDARAHGDECTLALAAAVTALSEAEDLMPRASQPAAAIDAAAIFRGHQTAPFVGPLGERTSAAAARQLYLQFACEQFAAAAKNSETASIALHGLGKIHCAGGATSVDARGKAQTFYEAALAAGPGNFLAANDLAVLLAEDGQLERARDVLHAGLQRAPQPAMWSNLASIHDRLGQTQLAQLARNEARTLELRAQTSPGEVLPTHNVAWLDARAFAATSRNTAETFAPPSNVAAVPPPMAPQPVAAPPAAVPPGGPAAGHVWAQRPVNRTLAY